MEVEYVADGGSHKLRAMGCLRGAMPRRQSVVSGFRQAGNPSFLEHRTEKCTRFSDYSDAHSKC
ncbi:hypothetical protein SAMN03080618_02726 [Aquamicrobium aerolatum DSM 21857]|uniref:Uncharacterized protein n=1 Tax=Aquamicrobium aerolatum DSM 21857 TaxID=1121003 RepID=A0A1I3QQW4_9HYPH|nr:hypothetical protein SAMN03080618_02726 [Aquamicrobium aerolatum DSM 21857]